MPLDLATAATMTDAQLRRLSPKARRTLEDDLAEWTRKDAQANQLDYYQPVNAEARKVHLATAREIGIQGGRRAGKTGVGLAEVVIQATGIIPAALAADYPTAKLRGREYPIRVRITVTSLVTAWDINLRQKLQWFEWNGRLNEDDIPGDPRTGHWGWIPRAWLIDGDWDRSWSEKHRTLTLWHPEKREKWSTFQVISHEQSIKEFQQGAYHLIFEDELPDEEIHRANRLRVMETGGQIITGGTPPDDRSTAITAAWFFDQIIAPGLEGSNPEETAAVILPTDENRTLDPRDIAQAGRGMSEEQKRAIFRGEAIHLSGRIITGFTEKPKTWCFTCEGTVLVVPDPALGDRCGQCRGVDLVRYGHLWDDADLDWPGPANWPTLYYMDPHQAKPTACAWYKIDPQDGWWQIHEMEIAGDAAEVKRQVEAFESAHQLAVVWRKGDPKITAQNNQFAREVDGQTFTIRRAFEEVGFWFDDANTNFTVAINRIEQALRPNPITRAPRLRIHRSCTRTAYHLTHLVWSATRRDPMSDTKEQPAKRHSDFVAVTRYLAMDDPEWRGLHAYIRNAPVSMVAAGVGRGVTGW